MHIENSVSENSCNYITHLTKNVLCDVKGLNEQTALWLTTKHSKKINIKVLGNQLAILQHIAILAPLTADCMPYNSAAFNPPPASLKMPSTVSKRRHPEFCKFVIGWNVYNQMTGLPSSQVGPHLYNACNDPVEHGLVNLHLTFFDMDESAMLEVNEKIVVKCMNPVIHWMNCGNLMQSEGESIKDFLLRIRSLAVDCEFSCPACKTDISNINIKEQFTHGLQNKTLQTDILAKGTKMKTTDDIVKHALKQNSMISHTYTVLQRFTQHVHLSSVNSTSSSNNNNLA